METLQQILIVLAKVVLNLINEVLDWTVWQVFVIVLLAYILRALERQHKGGSHVTN